MSSSSPSPSSDPRDQKALLRARLKTELAQVSAARATASAARIADHILAWPAVQAASTILAFVPLPGEPDLSDFLLTAASLGKHLAAPGIDWDRKQLTPRLVPAWPRDLVTSSRGIGEPGPACPALPLGSIDVVLVPGLAFDRSGHRLGRGGGFYDRFLADPALRAPTIGVCFSRAFLADLPSQSHDARVHAVVTEDGVFPTAAPNPPPRVP